MRLLPRKLFWEHVFEGDGIVRNHVARVIMGFTGYTLALYLLDILTPSWFKVGLEVTPYELAGGVLGALVVLRVNTGHDRWWEARKLWGGITNECRNLAILALTNGPDNVRWRREIVGWTASFAHCTRRNLRGQVTLKEVAALVGAEEADRLAAADHMPSAASMKIAALLREARDDGSLDKFAYMQAEAQRCLLIDHVGGCERILKTPLATAYVVLIRRFLFLFFLFLPFALIPRVGWLSPIFTLLIAYPLIALDHIADDLQHPFSTRSVNHLPLDDITFTIERNLLALLTGPAEGGEPKARVVAATSGE